MLCPRKTLVLIILNMFPLVILIGCSSKSSLETTNFERLITSKNIYVDKTELIKDIMCDSVKVVIITQPRKFGKSLGLSMLQHFLDRRHKTSNGIDIFRGLKISKHTNICLFHRNKYPVIHISFEDITATNYQTAKLQILSLLQKLFRQHHYLLEENSLNAFNKLKFGMIQNGTASIDNLKDAISSLCDFLGNNKRLIKAKIGVVLLVDDYDKPLQRAYLNNYLLKMERLISRILSCLQNSPFLTKAIITGSFPVELKEKLFKLVNVYTVLDGIYAKHFGFTSDELNNLSTKSVVSLRESEQWYRHNFSGTVVCNPWSILNCLRNNGKTSLWVRPPGTKLVLHLFRLVGVSEAANLKYLLAAGAIDKEIRAKILLKQMTTEEEYFWTALVHAGYLTASCAHKYAGRIMYTLSVQNEEVKRELTPWYQEKFRVGVGKVSKDLDDFVTSVLNGKVQNIGGFISKSLSESGVYYDFRKAVDVRRYRDYLLALLTPLRAYYRFCYPGQESFHRSPSHQLGVHLVPTNESWVCWALGLGLTSEEENLGKAARMTLEKVKINNFTLQCKVATCDKVIAVGMAFWRQSVDLEFEMF